MFQDVSFSIVGAGRVGTAIGVLLQRAGHRIVGCSARTSESLERAVNYLGCFSSTNIHEVYNGADAIVIAVPDAAIETVAETLAARGIDQGTIVVHASGAFGLDPLLPLQESGARLAAVHPLQSIPSVEAGIERIPGSWFGTTCDPELVGWVESFVGAMRGHVYWVADAERSLYHTAAAFASNYLVVLASLMQEMGFEIAPYLKLMEGTLANLNELGPSAALTGPIVRGDVETVRFHLDAIRSRDLANVESAYRALGLCALEFSVKSGRLDRESALLLRDVLERYP